VEIAVKIGERIPRNECKFKNVSTKKIFITHFNILLLLAALTDLSATIINNHNR
jgi:hypothetical protein